MNFKNLFIPLLLSLTTLYSLKIYSLSSKTNEIKVIKFMYSKEYLFDYGEKMFWDNPEEHAFMNLDMKWGDKNDPEKILNIKDKVLELNISDSKTFKNYNYCFLVPNKNSIDTLYTDFSLKSWLYKKNGKKTYYYDESGYIAYGLRGNYSFFKDCW